MTNRRFLTLLIASVGLISIISLYLTRPKSPVPAFINTPIHPVAVDHKVLNGGAIMGKIGNETLK